uniref:Uncharacterized protein n=1 Tax=Timema tahoe TaxID=61484 RepID=A0A7R9NVX5_9NEOP|nr:unnamed protein product [Timema tahoe]
MQNRNDHEKFLVKFEGKHFSDVELSWESARVVYSSPPIDGRIVAAMVGTNWYCTVSADGNYEVRYKSNVLIYPNGEVLWVPPAIYQGTALKSGIRTRADLFSSEGSKRKKIKSARGGERLKGRVCVEVPQ